MKRLLVCMLVLVLGGCRNPAQSQEQGSTALADSAGPVNQKVSQARRNAITRAVDKAAPAVVSINVIEARRGRGRGMRNPFFERFFGRGERRRKVQNVGSGFIISEDGYIVTNDHVAGDAEKVTVSLSSGETIDARLVGTDAASDIALLKANYDEPLPHVEFARDARPIPGEWVVALGNPFGLFKAAQPSVTVGVVSAVGRDLQPQKGRIYRNMIQTDASINRGNSGGPLVNAMGKVIGVNAAIYSQSGGSVGIGFAVPADKARRIIRELRETGNVDRSYYTGLYMHDVSRRIARALDLESAEGVFVRDLERDSPADKGGFQRYDVIVSANGEPVKKRSDLVAIIYQFRPGDKVDFEVIRDGERKQLTMKLGRRG